MPDLDLMKQGGTGGAGPVRAVRQGPVGQSGRPRGCLDRVNRAARFLLPGEGEALTRAKPSNWRSLANPTAMRLCLDRILPPCREHPDAAAARFARSRMNSCSARSGVGKALTTRHRRLRVRQCVLSRQR
jgi:hypothetical protein